MHGLLLHIRVANAELLILSALSPPLPTATSVGSPRTAQSSLLLPDHTSKSTSVYRHAVKPPHPKAALLSSVLQRVARPPHKFLRRSPTAPAQLCTSPQMPSFRQLRITLPTCRHRPQSKLPAPLPSSPLLQQVARHSTNFCVDPQLSHHERMQVPSTPSSPLNQSLPSLLPLKHVARPQRTPLVTPHYANASPSLLTAARAGSPPTAQTSVLLPRCACRTRCCGRPAGQL